MHLAYLQTAVIYYCAVVAMETVQVAPTHIKLFKFIQCAIKC